MLKSGAKNQRNLTPPKSQNDPLARREMNAATVAIRQVTTLEIANSVVGKFAILLSYWFFYRRSRSRSNDRRDSRYRRDDRDKDRRSGGRMRSRSPPRRSRRSRSRSPPRRHRDDRDRRDRRDSSYRRRSDSDRNDRRRDDRGDNRRDRSRRDSPREDRPRRRSPSQSPRSPRSPRREDSARHEAQGNNSQQGGGDDRRD